MKEYFKKWFKYQRRGLYFEIMKLVIDEIPYEYDLAFKVKEINKFDEDSLVQILDVFSMDRKPLSDYTKGNLIEKAPQVIKTNNIKWEESSDIKKEIENDKIK